VIRDYAARAQASQIWVRFHGHDQVQAQLVAIDQWNDLAVLRIDPSQVKGLVAAPIGTAETSLVGAEVAAIGHPFGHEWTQTPGHITSLHQTVDSQINGEWQIPDAIEFDSAINQGNSGGPLFDARGKVIGIVQQIAGTSKTSSGVAFAIPSSIIQRTLALSKSHANIPYAWTGIEALDLTPQLGRDRQLGVETGALVQETYGPARAAGIVTGSKALVAGKQVGIGDVIIGIAGQPVASAADLRRISGLLTPGSPVDVVIMRGGNKQTLRLTPATETVTAG
jgi:S1-C subfamily serine protease